MKTQHDASTTAVFDPDGFLIDPAMWNENLADHIAQTDGIGPLNCEPVRRAVCAICCAD